MLLNLNKKFYKTPYHFVDPSPWPLLTAFSIFQLPISLILFWDTGTIIYFIFSLLCLISVLILWANDITVEGTFQGMHTEEVEQGLIIGFFLFIISEVMLFATFFGSFFYYILDISIWAAMSVPVKKLSLIDPAAVPFFNSIILLISSFFITIAHDELIKTSKEGGVNRNFVFITTFFTIFFGFFFVLFQFWEYKTAQVSIQDTIFGSLFYLITGFHGLHVIFGILFLTVMITRLNYFQFSPEHHLGFEFAAFYWHFVDSIWFIVYLFLYVFPYQ